jgi:uncharacterized membrane protein
VLAPSIRPALADRYAFAWACGLTIVGLFLIFGPLIGPLSNALALHSVNPPLPILLCLFLAYQLVLPRLTAKGFSWPASVTASFPVLLIVVYAAALSWLAVRKHDVINSHTDLAIFDNVMWNTIHGRALYSSILQRNFLGEHVAPILLLLTPMYWLAPSAATLLVVQSCALAIAVLPVYWLAKERLEPRAAFILLVVYFFNRAILGAAFFDFHEIALAVPLIAFAFYYCEHQRDALFMLTLLGAMLCKEEVALIVAAFGIYIWVRRGRSPLAICLMLLGLIVFLIDYNLVLPYFRDRPGPYADRYSYLGTSIPNILWNTVRHPFYLATTIFTIPKLSYLCILFGSLAFLPLLAPVHLIPVVPTLLRVTLSGLVPEYSFDFHYSAPICPFLFFAAIFSAERLSHRLTESKNDTMIVIRRWATRRADRYAFLQREIKYISAQDLIMSVVLIAGGTFGMNPLSFANSPKAASDVSSLAAIERALPADASLAGDETLIAQFSQRRELAFLPSVNNADFVVMDFAGDRFEYPLSRQEHRRLLLTLVFDGDYGVKLNSDGVLLLQRGLKQGPDEVAKLIAPIFFEYPEDQIETRRCHICESGLDHIAFTLGHLYPPGKYAAIFRLGGNVSYPTKAVLDVHATEYVGRRKDQFEEPKYIGRERVAIPQGIWQRHSFELFFDNPNWNDLMFRVMLPHQSGITIESIDVQPQAPLERTLQTLRNY